MEKAFVYGMSVKGNNVILISPRRMGKTSLVKKVISEIDNPMLKIVYMDIYDCRSEYDFYNRFAETIMKSTGNQLEQIMENIFQSRRMPFYQFGEMLHLKCIPTEYWVPFICSRFEKYGKSISEEYATLICNTVKNYSSYVQQLAWNVMAETEKVVDEESFNNGSQALLEQNSSLFIQQTESLTTYQLNFIRLLCNGVHNGFTAQSVAETYTLGSKSNIDRIKKSLIDKEIITLEKEGVFLADCVFELWFKREML